MNLEGDKPTICAISTPLGGGAMAVVRLSGSRALSILQTLTQQSSFPPRYAKLCYVYDGDEVLDEVIAIYFKAPHSYTREDVVEIQCHGGSVIARRILEFMLECGARLAQSGEFTKRAFLNGRIDLAQAQAIAQMIEAKSLQAQKALARQLRGELSEFVQGARESLYEALAYSEVMIDYSDEDLPQDLLERLGEKIDGILQRLEKILSHSLSRSGIFEGFRLSIIGKPNVGKSSLLNALLMRERAIVSEVAGTTRDTIEESLSIAGVQVRIVDTAGIRESEDVIERIGIERSKEAMEQSDIILALFDRSREWESEDDEILKLLSQAREKKILVILNKSDLPQRLEKSDLEQYPCFCLSAKRGEIDLLLQALEEILSLEESDEVILSSAHQIQSVRESISSLKEAKVELENAVLELFSYNLKDAIHSIGAITQPYENAELLDKMFGEFCLGK